MKLTIQDGRDSFYTFDSNRILLLTATDEEQIKQVEFSTEEAGGTETWTKDVLEQEDGVKYVQVPNEFLNGDYTRLVCYAVSLDSKGEFTRQKEVFRIKYRPQPEDWFLTYSERVTFASIKALTEQYKSNASDSAELASKYAENNEDVAVESGKYSAKHWSIKSNKKYEEIRSYVGSASDPESALGSIESARANAVSDVEKQETDSIEAVGTYTSNTAIPSVSQYVEDTAKPALKTYGEQQVDSYVNGTSKPELDRYVNNDKKQVLDEYTAEKKTELDIYTSVDKKQVLDSYTENEKKTELDSHTVGLKEQLDAHTVAKAGDLNEHTTSLKGTLDGYTTAKEQEISEFTEQKKQEVQGVYQSDLNELKGDLVNYKVGVNQFSIIENSYVELDGTITDYGGWSRTDYIDCSLFDRITVKNESRRSVYNCWFDENKNPIVSPSFTLETGTTTLRIPNNARYVIFSNTNTGIKGLTIYIQQLTINNFLLDSVSYLDKSALKSGNLFDKSLVSEDDFIIFDGVPFALNGYVYSDYIEIVRDKDYIVTKALTSLGCLYDSNKVFVSNITIDTPTNDYIYHADTNGYIRINVEKNKIDNFCFSEGTEYKIYPIGNRVTNENAVFKSSQIIDINKLSGKTALFIGDSITDDAKWVNALNDIIGFEKIYNRGLGGTTIAKTGDGRSFCERVNLPYSDADDHSLGMPYSTDIVFLYGGINDWGKRDSTGELIGNVNEQPNRNTFCGAIKYVIENLKTKYPNAMFVMLSNYRVYSPDRFPTFSEITYPNGTSMPFEYVVSSEGKTLDDYRDAYKYIASLYGIPVIDMLGCGFSFILPYDKEKYSYPTDVSGTIIYDGLHPSVDGGKKMAEYISAQLKSLVN